MMHSLLDEILASAGEDAKIETREIDGTWYVFVNGVAKYFYDDNGTVHEVCAKPEKTPLQKVFDEAMEAASNKCKCESICQCPDDPLERSLFLRRGPWMVWINE